MKLRLLLSSIVVAAYGTLALFFSFTEAPLRGAANAAVLHDTLESYVLAKLSADWTQVNLLLALLVAFFLIWALLPKTTQSTPSK